MTPIGIFGGTFDPIHYGHLRTAFELLQAIEFGEIRFVPSGDPPHRGETFANAAARLQMVRLATAGQPDFVVDDREYERDGPSYTVDTLASMRAQDTSTPLGLITGMDAFLGLTTWHQWQKILDMAHIVVAHRPGWKVPDTGTLGELIAERGTMRPGDLHAQPAGFVHIHAVTQLEISSTEIRELVAAGRSPRYLIPDVVCDFIAETGCYGKVSREPA